jgi:hypothetical protein
MWLEYLKECLFEEIDIVLTLAGIDQQVQGEKNEVNDLIGFINDNIDNLSFYNFKDEDIVIDGHPISLIKALNDLVEKSIKVVVLKNNLAINKWIVERYKDFISDNGSLYGLDLTISDTFDMSNSTVAIGSKGFVKEMKECLEVDVRGIVEEY